MLYPQNGDRFSHRSYVYLPVSLQSLFFFSYGMHRAAIYRGLCELGLTRNREYITAGVLASRARSSTLKLFAGFMMQQYKSWQYSPQNTYH